MRVSEIREEKVIKDPPQKFFMRAFGMINTYPNKASFITQNEEEDVVIVLRKHVSRNIGMLINTILFIFLPGIITAIVVFIDGSYFQNVIFQSEVITSINANFLFVILLFYYSFVFSYVFLNFLHWYYDLFIVTTERFISIDFDVLKGKTVTDIPLIDIVDIKEKALGLIPTLLGYATIEFKTVSELKMIINGIPEATWFRDSFADLIKVVRQVEELAVQKPRGIDIKTAPQEINDLKEFKSKHEVSSQQQVSKNIEP